MSTMNISLPEELKAFVDQQVGSRGYSSSSEYVRELIRREQDREQLRALILDGAASPLSATLSWRSASTPARARPIVSSDRMVKVSTRPGNTA